MKIKTHLKVNGEPVYIVISKPILRDCYEEDIDGYTYPMKKVKIIYLPTIKHIQKFLVKHEYYHLLHHQYMKPFYCKYYSLYVGKIGKDKDIIEIRKEEVDSMLYAGEIYKKGNTYYIKKYFIDKRIELRNYVKEEYLKLNKRKMANKEIDI